MGRRYLSNEGGGLAPAARSVSFNPMFAATTCIVVAGGTADSGKGLRALVARMSVLSAAGFVVDKAYVFVSC